MWEGGEGRERGETHNATLMHHNRRVYEALCLPRVAEAFVHIPLTRCKQCLRTCFEAVFLCVVVCV